MNPIFEYKKKKGGCEAFLKGPPELLALLPAPDPKGVALAEIEKGVWVVADNDCQEFATKEEAAFFYLDTVLVYPARRAQIPLQAADIGTPYRWPKKLDQEQAKDIFDILVRFLGAPDDRRKEFYEALVGNDTQVSWVFESWGGHRVTFEYNIGPDFRGDAMTASGFSSLLVSHAMFAIQDLYRPASAPPRPAAQAPTFPTRPKISKHRHNPPKPQPIQSPILARTEVEIVTAPSPIPTPSPAPPVEPVVVAVPPPKAGRRKTNPPYKRPVISMTSTPLPATSEDDEELPDVADLFGLGS